MPRPAMETMAERPALRYRSLDLPAADEVSYDPHRMNRKPRLVFSGSAAKNRFPRMGINQPQRIRAVHIAANGS
jgi:hypothetical protein